LALPLVAERAKNGVGVQQRLVGGVQRMAGLPRATGLPRTREVGLLGELADHQLHRLVVGVGELLVVVEQGVGALDAATPALQLRQRLADQLVQQDAERPRRHQHQVPAGGRPMLAGGVPAGRRAAGGRHHPLVAARPSPVDRQQRRADRRPLTAEKPHAATSRTRSADV
jgi:hypothetical protein